MSGLWEPAIKVEVTAELLVRYLKIATETDLEAIEANLSADDIKHGAPLMKLQAKDWQVAETLSDSELEHLIRFFTKAEMQLAGWDAGKTSPVIYLAKILKKRGAFDPELKKWVKANTDNRFLPNGAVLL